ncbi:MAG: ABC transporter substrate-binding protein [Streptosporangiales bacterium]|nr:ABC transporter substrate-binding protein [Streptosporangiales bacterium]
MAPHRRAIAAIACLTTAAALAACAPAGSESAEEKKPSGKFVVARTGDLDKLDPHVATAFQTIDTLSMIYEPLVRVDAKGKLIPALATKWEPSDGGRTMTFTLRKGVKWQNGDPFTSADVKASIDRILDEKTGAVARSNIAVIDEVTTPDDQTAVFELSAPNSALLYALVSVNSAMVHEADVEAGTVDKEPNGTGAFAWKSRNQGQQVLLTGNKDYWGGAPKIGELEFRVIPTESSILSGMRAGTFQLGMLSDPSVAKQAGDKGGDFSVVKEAALSYHTLMLNGRRGPLKDVRVRQAIACAIDRQEVVDTAAFGDGRVTGPITSPAFPYDATDGLPCEPGDTAAAKKLLADAGHTDDVKLRTIVQTGEYATAVAEGQNLQAQLKKIGVTLELDQLSTDPFVTAWLEADFDASVALNGGSYDPYLMYGRYFTEGGSLAKAAGLDSKRLHSLLSKGNATTDEATRTSTYRQLQERLLEESPWVWLFRGDNYYLVGKDVKGFEARPDGSLFSLTTTSVG